MDYQGRSGPDHRKRERREAETERWKGRRRTPERRTGSSDPQRMRRQGGDRRSERTKESPAGDVANAFRKNLDEILERGGGEPTEPDRDELAQAAPGLRQRIEEYTEGADVDADSRAAWDLLRDIYETLGGDPARLS